jgi:hypothetical protein
VNRAKATVTVKVAFVDPPEGVFPDMSARVSFLKGELDDEAIKARAKLIVPASAVVDRDGAKVVFAIDGDRVRMVPITVGAQAGNGLEVTNGAGAGTRVVNNPPDTLADGQRVKERDDG